ncbi:hypothetical protein C2W62_37570 [Candidatus Entotheonella serta]|nr:hypothetical protein C2W62_37570 [Candidatus Entotheonella serta]
MELLERGEVRPILPGQQFIHALFYLYRPSVSICVRTGHSPTGSPQFNYSPPYFAQDPFYTSPELTKKVQSVGMLLTMNHPDTDALVAELLSNADVQTAIAMIDRLQAVRGNAIDHNQGLSRGEDRYQAWLDVARKRHGELIERVQPVCDEMHRQNYITGRRR